MIGDEVVSDRGEVKVLLIVLVVLLVVIPVMLYNSFFDPFLKLKIV